MVRRALRRLRVPSLPTAISLLALSIVVTGTAFAATGQLVNIADGSNAARLAHVSSTGSVQIGDGAGPLTVDGTTTSREAPLTEAVHFAAFVNTYTDCVSIATPPTGKALVIKTLRVNAYAIGDASSGQHYVHLTIGACSGGQENVLYAHATSADVDHYSFEPGLIVPGGKSLIATTSAPGESSLYTEVSGEGYKVASSAVRVAANVGPALAGAPPAPGR
ncbi:MAG TPA: hypothetical protein VF533_08455 [Solirubrobacteraceae bacterium]|jgi:hypothetical protein